MYKDIANLYFAQVQPGHDRANNTTTSTRTDRKDGDGPDRSEELSSKENHEEELRMRWVIMRG